MNFDTPHDEQIRVLARNIDLIHERITAVHSALTTEDRAIRDVLDEKARNLADEGSHLREHVKQYGTSGLHISAIGAVWLFFGAVLGTAASEIAHFLQ